MTKIQNSTQPASRFARYGAVLLALLQVCTGIPAAAYPGSSTNANDQSAAQASATPKPIAATPIQHVIVIIGENRTFDHVFATYKPKAGQTVSNLLSKGIITPDGKPGPNYFDAAQYSAEDRTSYSNSPQDKSLYSTLPPLMTGGAPESASNTSPAPFKTLDVAELAEPDLPAATYPLLLTGATGLPSNSIDTRLPDASSLREGPYQLTPYIKYDDYASSPVHRFFQMWQQLDCSAYYATSGNPSGCLADLFPWVEVTVATGSNGKPQPNDFNDTSTGEGSTSMGFYNVLQGDAPYLKSLADEYALSDNYHQAVMGGTGANHIMLGFGDAIWYSDGKGTPATPPKKEIENPNPQNGTNNYYTQDGYSGGSYVNCADTAQRGVSPILDYLGSLSRPIKSNCRADRYYLVNNYNPGYNGDGTLAAQYSPYTIPPSSVRSIGDVMLDHNLSFKYYGDHWNLYVTDPNFENPYDQYCNICNPFQYETSIMANPAVREAHINDTDELYEDLATGDLPAVSIVKPSGFVDGHPASSKLDLFEGFVKEIVSSLQANPKLWASTAVFVTVDEGGGYYDSGYVQPLDFFGDGTRIPLVVVSPYSTGGRVVHTYYDHVSILKFIERNWGLPHVTSRSRDNLPNPTTADDPYVPTNSPAIGDLMEMFDFRASAHAPNQLFQP